MKSPGLDFEHIYVYGDPHYTNYPQYDGLATDGNIENKIEDIVDIADENDIIVFVFSGHGGESYGDNFLLTYYSSFPYFSDVCIYDYELKHKLDDAIAERIFVIFDACHSGGFGSSLMDMENSDNVYLTTPCSDDGFAYGSWISCFLGITWMYHYNSNPTIPMEKIFYYANLYYNPTNPDDELPPNLKQP